METIKKVLSLICCLALLLSMIHTVGATDSDIDEDNLYRPNPMCGTYLGQNADGVYEFEITIPDDRENQPTPLLPGPFYSSHEIVATGNNVQMISPFLHDPVIFMVATPEQLTSVIRRAPVLAVPNH